MKAKIICISEPDISYTRNKKLTVQETYIARYVESDLSQFGICKMYDVFDLEDRYLGQYFSIDFDTIEEYRDKKLSQILN